MVLTGLAMSDDWVQNKAVVNIFGEEYPISGVSDPSHISRVADFVDAKMRETAQASQALSRDRIAILAAMSIASELFETRDQIDALEHKMDDQASTLLTRLDEAVG